MCFSCVSILRKLNFGSSPRASDRWPGLLSSRVGWKPQSLQARATCLASIKFWSLTTDPWHRNLQTVDLFSRFLVSLLPFFLLARQSILNTWLPSLRVLETPAPDPPGLFHSGLQNSSLPPPLALLVQTLRSSKTQFGLRTFWC